MSLLSNPESFYDHTPMPFGKHKGTPLGHVPAAYLLWLWDDGYHLKTLDPLHQYIATALDDLWKECPKFEFKNYKPKRR